MKSKKQCGTISFIACLMLLLVASPLAAQDKWTVSAKAAANFPTQDFASLDIQAGFGFEGTIAYRLIPRVTVVTGWDWERFPANSNTAKDIEASGYQVGLKLVHPQRPSGSAFFLGFGGIYQHIEAQAKESNHITDTGHGWGWQAETGWVFPLNNWLRVVPALRYRSLSRDIDWGGGVISSELNYVSLQAGLQWGF